ncbi:MAG: hypothetical protein H8F28_21100 [Fibrella sp.]|nr:hypothetical protein [Armatimonadota bacterium]
MISGMLTVTTVGGFFYLGKNRAESIITGVDSPVITISRAGNPMRYRDLNGEYQVCPARITITGSGFVSGGGGVIQGKEGTVRVSRYALRFDDVPFPMSDLPETGKKGNRLSGTLQVPVELLTESEINKPRGFHVYDRTAARFVKVAPETAAMVRFKMSEPIPR